jgi:hypothetical protein
LTPPNSELVAVAWLASIAGLEGIVSTTLPKDVTGWAATGFVTLGAGGGGGVIGGRPDLYLQTRHPVLSVHTWATVPGSAKPPWGMAAALAELVVAGCWDEENMRRDLTLPAGYDPARAMEAYPLTEPRRIPGDVSGYAHFQLDLQLHWVATA